MLQSGRLDSNHLKRGISGRDRGGVGGVCTAIAAANAGSGGGSGALSASKEPDHPVIELLREASWEVQDLAKAAVAVLRRKPAYEPLQVTPWCFSLPTADPLVVLAQFVVGNAMITAPTLQMYGFC